VKRPKIAAAAAGAAVIIAGGVSAALVVTSSAAPAHAAMTHFNATYHQGKSTWTCSGTRTVTKSGGAKESETCLITGLTAGYAKVVGTYTGRPGVRLPGMRPGSPPVRWHSDYNHVIASAYTITFKNTHHVEGSGQDTYQVHITAFYKS
jgi:hypothetical protein